MRATPWVLVLAMIASFAIASCAPASPPRASKTALALPNAAPDHADWDRLSRALAGTWTKAPPSSGAPFIVRYKLISNESALVEDWGVGSTHETQTVFHPDGNDILLTHYCAQGNQPRLRAVRGASGDAFVFRFVDVTNRGPDQAILVERTLRFAGDIFEDTEVYRQPDGTNESSTFRFTRMPSPPSSP